MVWKGVSISKQKIFKICSGVFKKTKKIQLPYYLFYILNFGNQMVRGSDIMFYFLGALQQKQTEKQKEIKLQVKVQIQV